MSKMSKLNNLKLLIAAIGFSFLMAGCSHIHPYHIPVQQGNVLEAKTVQQVKIGMSKHEVADLLGLPVLGDCFDNCLWTYAYTSKIDGKPPVKQDLILHFKGDRLVLIEKHL